MPRVRIPTLVETTPTDARMVTLWVARDLGERPTYTLWRSQPSFRRNDDVVYYAADDGSCIEIEHEVVVALGLGLQAGDCQRVEITVRGLTRFAADRPPEKRSADGKRKARRDLGLQSIPPATPTPQ